MERKLALYLGIFLAAIMVLGALVGGFLWLEHSKSKKEFNKEVESAEDEINSMEDGIKREIAIKKGYKGPQGDTILTISNTGSETINFSKETIRLFVDGQPKTWDYVDPTSKLRSGGTVEINTTVNYPSEGAKEFKITGPNDMTGGLICSASQGQECS
jgi:archaellum component FlaG (FlaF/FlaG flagellin family)